MVIVKHVVEFGYSIPSLRSLTAALDISAESAISTHHLWSLSCTGVYYPQEEQKNIELQNM